MSKIYLASQSKGRLLILTNAGYEVMVFPTDCNETGQWETPAIMVEDLAVKKMQAFIKSGNYTDKSIPAITSDTVVVFDNKVIGKAHSKEEAISQLTALSGRTHTVYSSYCVCVKGQLIHGFDSADVTFKNINNLIPSYIESKEWQGAAGSYRLQGPGAQFIEKISGDTNTVIGLPLKIVSPLISTL